MTPIKKLEQEINNIKERNKRVEAGKAWEISWARRILILILTYIVIAIFFVFANIPKPFANAGVPALAFFLSTLSLPIFKKIWLKYFYRKNYPEAGAGFKYLKFRFL